MTQKQGVLQYNILKNRGRIGVLVSGPPRLIFSEALWPHGHSIFKMSSAESAEAHPQFCTPAVFFENQSQGQAQN